MVLILLTCTSGNMSTIWRGEVDDDKRRGSVSAYEAAAALPSSEDRSTISMLFQSMPPSFSFGSHTLWGGGILGVRGKGVGVGGGGEGVGGGKEWEGEGQLPLTTLPHRAPVRVAQHHASTRFCLSARARTLDPRMTGCSRSKKQAAKASRKQGVG